MKIQIAIAAVASILFATCVPARARVRGKVLHRFAGYPNDGSHPYGGPTMDKNCNLFGYGDAGAEPYGTLIMDGAGNLYGTAYEDSNKPCWGPKENRACGNVFEVHP